MGIPMYFHKITNHFKNVVGPHKPSKRCDRLFLDFNGIVHNCARDVKQSVAPNAPVEVFEDALLDAVISYTEKVCAYANPKSLVCICVDGVAPLAKIMQQRKRRYLSGWMKGRLKEDGYAWDTNAISPGTPFMHKLSAKLHAFARQHASSKPRSYKIHVSDSSERGEGEHKIYEYIRTHEAPKGIVDVIYGLDADLIMLSLLCTRTRKFLMREPQNFSSVPNPSNAPFLWFDVDACREKVLEFYEFKINIESYVFLCTMIGNDFLPNLTYLTIHNSGIDHIMDAYKQALKLESGPIVFCDEDGLYKVNHITLSILLDALKLMEDVECKQLHATYYKKTMILNTNKLKIENYGVLNKNLRTKNMFDSCNWRMYYYAHLFDMNQYKDTLITDCCRQYVQGLEWVVSYYMNKNTPQSNWYYMFNYSQTILDLYNYVEVNKKELGNSVLETEIHGMAQIDENIQLMLIMPLSSIEVLPQKLQDIMTSDLNVRHYYPIEFKIETYLKTKLHECYPILPHICVNDLHVAYLNTIS